MKWDDIFRAFQVFYEIAFLIAGDFPRLVNLS